MIPKNTLAKRERERERIICTGVPIGVPFLSAVEQRK